MPLSSLFFFPCHQYNMMNQSYGSDSTLPNTTYVQLADPSNFRAVVQRLTGAAEDDPSSPKLPLTLPARYANPNKPAAFKLHERRRQSTKNLELHLTTATATSSSQFCGPQKFSWPVIMSPVSPFEFLVSGSPRTPASPVVEEKGLFPIFCHGDHHDPPELLPLFPLHSPSSLT